MGVDMAPRETLDAEEDGGPPSSVAGSPSMLSLLTRGPEVCSLQEKGTKAPKGKER